MLTPAHGHADVHLNREQCWTAPLKLSCLSRAAGDKRFHQSINTAGEPADRQVMMLLLVVLLGVGLNSASAAKVRDDFIVLQINKVLM